MAKLSTADATALEVCIEQADEFLNEGEHTMEEYDEKQKEISDFFDPLQVKLTA